MVTWLHAKLRWRTWETTDHQHYNCLHADVSIKFKVHLLNDLSLIASSNFLLGFFGDRTNLSVYIWIAAVLKSQKRSFQIVSLLCADVFNTWKGGLSHSHKAAQSILNLICKTQQQTIY